MRLGRDRHLPAHPNRLRRLSQDAVSKSPSELSTKGTNGGRKAVNHHCGKKEDQKSLHSLIQTLVTILVTVLVTILVPIINMA